MVWSAIAAFSVNVFTFSASADQISLSESIVVTGRREAASLESFEARHKISDDEIENAAASSVDELVSLLPSAHIPVNSRGEAILFLRNAGERQATVFIDGAAINIPWDNRIDLSLVPAGLVGSARLSAGPLAPHYGVNTLGAVNLLPRDATTGGEARLSLGKGGFWSGDIYLPLITETTASLAVGGGYSTRDGEPVSKKAQLVFSQEDRELRTNTDRDLASVFAAGHVDGGGARFSLTALHVEGEKGAAPEGDRADGARFWRYPDVVHTLAVLHGDIPIGETTNLDSTFWLQRFRQTIDAYTNAEYENIDSREVGRDLTFGVRQILSHEIGRAKFVGSLSYLASRHRQRDLDFEMGALALEYPEALVYSQRNFTVSGEVEYLLTPHLVAEIGAGFDRVSYIQTGDKPPINAAAGWSGRAGLIFETGGGWRLRGAVSRKMRAPTMRELFGEAFDRFLVNPNLAPERIVTAEVSAAWRGQSARLYITPFFQKLDGAIDQRRAGRLRQRINLKGSRILGLEFGGNVELTPFLKLLSAVTLSDVKRKGAAPGESDKIAEKPALFARVAAEYRHASGLGGTLEVEHVGRAYSLNEAGKLAPLKQATSLNARLSYNIALATGQGELFVNLDNLTDAIIEPQFGLPAPGRMIRGGFRLKW